VGKLAPLTPIGLVAVFLAVPALTAMHRQRLRSTAGVEIPPLLEIGDRWTLPGFVGYARSRATWRQLGYHFLAAPAIAMAAIAVVGVWLAGILYTLVCVYAPEMQRQGLLFRGRSSSPANSLPHLLGVPVDVYLTVLGIVLLAAAPRLTAAVCALDARAARALLGPSRAEELRANLDSGGGLVRATGIEGPLTVRTEGAPLLIDGLVGALNVDTGNAPLIAEGVDATTVTVSTDGGGARIAFAAAPDSVTVSTDGGAAFLTMPGGPYALTADSDGGPESVGIATDPAAGSSLTVSTGGAPLRIEPAPGA
jgi:hypothetical protein